MEPNEGSPDAQSEINALLGIGAPESNSGSTDATGTSGTTPQGDAKNGVFNFGGRAYKTQQEAEQAHNKLYGKYSEQQNTMNTLKSALKNPEALKYFSKDPQMVQILAKLGIQEATEMRREEEKAIATEEREFDPKQLYTEIRQERAAMQLDREEMLFERKLGRQVSDEEHNEIFKTISRVPELTYAEAWKLTYHDKTIKEIQEQAAAKAKPARPAPTPFSRVVPGVKMDLKKDIGNMTKSEAREAMRQDSDFQNLLSRMK
jgi:hypothetical protein